MKRIGDIFTTLIVLAAIIGLTWGSYKIGNKQYESLRDSISVLTPDTLVVHDTIMPENRINWIDSTVLSYVQVFDTVYMDSINVYNDSIDSEDVTIFLQELLQMF